MPTIVHFDIASDNVKRAKKFYETLFDWKFTMPPNMGEYYLIDTTDAKGKPGVQGGLGERRDPSQTVSVYFGVNNIEAFIAKVKELGGKAPMPKMPVPGFGWVATCRDTEGNVFGLWQDDPTAK
jgi:predicted enzyme related to lactoylglutathione lyase